MRLFARHSVRNVGATIPNLRLEGGACHDANKEWRDFASTCKLGLNLYSRMQIPSLSSGCEIVQWIVALLLAMSDKRRLNRPCFLRCIRGRSAIGTASLARRARRARLAIFGPTNMAQATGIGHITPSRFVARRELE